MNSTASKLAGYTDINNFLDSSPSVNSMQVDKNFPSPRGDREKHQRNKIITGGHDAHQSQSGLAGDGDINCDPKSGDRHDCEDRAHRLHVKAREKLAVREMREAGGHAAAGAGQAGAIEEGAAIEAEAQVRSDAGGAWW